MAQFLLAVYMIEGDPLPAEEEIAATYADVDALNHEMQEAEAWVFAGGLTPPDDARVVRQGGGEILATDGPFPESKEQIGGFWVIEAPDMATALEWAQRATIACRRPVEVRPFQGG